MERFIRLAGGSLPKFKAKSRNLWNFRCVECGDSKKDPNKARGFIHWSEKDNTYFYKCHKCGYAKGFSVWLHSFNPTLSKEMLLETLRELGGGRDSNSHPHTTKPDIAPMDAPVFPTKLKKESINIVTEKVVNIAGINSGTMAMAPPDFGAMRPSVDTPKVNTIVCDVGGDIFDDHVDLMAGYKGDIFKGIDSIADLPKTHGARKYVQNREIPLVMFPKLFYVWRFGAWVNSWMPGKFKNYQLKHDEPRLVIPFYNKQGQVFAVQGRSFRKGADVLRYITIKKNDNAPKIYGLERINKNLPAMILEGPIDSMFINNALGMAGADVSQLETHISDYVMVYDNEPRSTEIVRRMRRDIDLGKSIVVWPKSILQKDVNDMILKGGYTQESINKVVYSSVYKGMTASMKFAEWSIIANKNKWDSKKRSAY